MLTSAVPPRVAKEYLAIRFFGKEKKTGAELRPAKPIGSIRANDTTATRTSLKKWICVLSVFIAIIPTYFVKCTRTLLKLNSKGPYSSSESEIYFRRCLFTFFIKHEIRHFHDVVVQKRQANVQQSLMHVQILFFCLLNLLVFRRSHCRPVIES